MVANGHFGQISSTRDASLGLVEPSLWGIVLPKMRKRIVGAGHSHSVAVPAGTAAGRHKSRLAGALALTTAFMAAEVVGGLWTGSLALLADAAHMLTDAGGLALALIAIRFAERPATPQKPMAMFAWKFCPR